ncbi:MAG: hypothetical protein RL367_233 [Pseudomonadota bacterium]|jgi:hypothetical protein
MTEHTLGRARLVELDDKLTNPLPEGKGKDIEVQFNPDSLKVTFANQLAQPGPTDQSAGTAGVQFVGAGTTKLALTLWFDVTAREGDPVDDVRRLTKDVIFFITPKDDGKGKKAKHIAPGARFIWGSFIFDGMVEGVEETLEFFSPEGKPLRASISLTMSQQKILVSKLAGADNKPTAVGEHKFTSAKQGTSLHYMVEDEKPGSGSGAGGSGGASKSPSSGWQGVAAGNGIEDPLRLTAGAMINLDLRADVGGGFGVSGGLSVTPPTGPSLPPAITIQPPKAQLGLH